MKEKGSEHYHLTVLTCVPSIKEFIPDKQIDINIIKSFPEMSTICTIVLSITELMKANDDTVVSSIFLQDTLPGKHAELIFILPALCNRIIEDRCVKPMQLLCTILAWMKENKVTRGTLYGKLPKSAIPA